MLELNFSTILLEMANFIIMAFILYRFLFKPLQNVLKKREQEILGAMSDAQLAKKEAFETRKLYEEKSNNIDAEIAARKNEARIVIERTRQQMLGEVQAQIDEVKMKTEETLEDLQEEAVLRHKEKIGDLASAFSKGILSDIISDQLQEKFQQEFLDRISTMNLSSYLEGTRPGETNFVKVIMAAKPTPDFEKRIAEIINKKFNKDVSLTYEVDPSLIAGAILRFENKLIDGSVNGQINILKKNYQEAV